MRASALSAGDRHDGGVIKKVRQVFESSAIVKLKLAHHANTMGAEAVIEPSFWSKGEHFVHEDRRSKGGDTGTGRITVHRFGQSAAKDVLSTNGNAGVQLSNCKETARASAEHEVVVGGEG